MATANFRPMLYGLPLIVGVIEDDLDEMDVWMDYENAELLAEQFSENLIFHNVTVVGGYYCGFQFYVEEKCSAEFDIDGESPYCIDNDDAWYYFNRCRSRALRDADAEKRKIRRWLENLDYTRLIVSGRFDNGCTLYSYA